MTFDPKTATVLDVARAASKAAAEATSAALAATTATAIEAPTPEAAAAAAATAATEAGKAAAIEPKPYAFKALSVDTGDHSVIVGIGAAAENIDLDDEVIRQHDLVAMSYDFCASKARAFKANHADPLPKAELVASWPGAPILKSGRVLKVGEALPTDDAVIGINIEKGRETHWFVKVRPNDAAIVEAAKAGDVAGFSWAGLVNRTPVTE